MRPPKPKNKEYVLRLYIAGTSSKSMRAVANIKEICESSLKNRYDLEVIDIYQQPVLMKGEQIIALHGADHSYRVLLEDMNEGAATLLADGSLLYCNKAFAEILKMPIEKVIGSSANDFVAPSDRQLFVDLLRSGEQANAKAEITFRPTDGIFVPVYCSISPVEIDEVRCLCLTATDLTDQKHH